MATTCAATPGRSSAIPTTEPGAGALPAPGPWQPARIVRTERATPSILRCFLAPAHPFRFVAGQHVDLRLTAEDGYQARRSYSIASSPGPESDNLLELAIERLEGGEVSTYFHDVARDGDEVELRGPIGSHFVWTPSDAGPWLFVGGGSGIVPLASMLRHRHASGSASRACLVHSARTAADLLYRGEFEAMQATGGLWYRPTVTRAGSAPGTTGPAPAQGRLDGGRLEGMLDLLGGAPKVAYLCGRNTFVESIAQSLLSLGVPALSIRTERYGR